MTTEAVGTWERRALVVDDDEDLLRLLCVLLEDIGISCERATDGENALALLKSLVFDLLVVDKNLPVMDGIEVARHARRLQPDVVTLVITGYASEESAHRAATAGVNDYLTKPIDVSRFRDRVRELLDEQPASVGYTPYEEPRRSRVSTIPPGPLERLTPPGQWTAWTLGRSDEDGKGAVSVLLVEPDVDVRDSLTNILTDIYCEVLAFSTPEQADPCAESGKFDVLVARPEILTSRRCWLSRREPRAPLGSLAILDRRGIDRVIEAIQLGARGALTPPFERSTVASEFTEAVKQLIEERYGD
jgi:DNA-binding response OmpR family regulator